MATPLVTDTRVLAGMRAQLANRAARLTAGEKALGWKAGFGAPAAMKTFELQGPLAGYMLSSNRVQSGATVSLKGWVKPVAEPEIAVWFASDLTDSDPQTVKAAIKGIGAAIELADMEFPPQDVVKILDGNIYHRHVILGPCDESRAGANLDGISSRVSRHGVAVDSPADLESNTGRILDVVCHVAATLAACGETISAGDVLICGSITPPIFLEANDTLLEHALDPCGTVSVNLSFT